MIRRSLFAGLLLATGSAHAISLGQVDTFQDGLPAEWMEGGPSPNPPSVISDGGPAGMGDAWLQNIASGSFGPGGAQIMFNFSQWTGNYVAAGVNVITASLSNRGEQDLAMRIAMEGAAGTRISSAEAFLLPADGQWYSASFSLLPEHLAVVSGANTPQEVLAAVTSLRILAAAGGPAWIGDFLPSVLGVDNITAAAAVVPVPGALWLLLSGLGLLAGGRTARRTK